MSTPKQNRVNDQQQQDQGHGHHHTGSSQHDAGTTLGKRHGHSRTAHDRGGPARESSNGSRNGGR